MPVVGTIDGVDIHDIGQCFTNMTDPFSETLRIFVFKIGDDPGQIGTIRLKATNLARGACFSDQQAVQNKALDTLRKQ